MDYNDIIIITLLVIIIGLVLVKKDYSYFTQFEKPNYENINNNFPQGNLEYTKNNDYINHNHLKNSNIRNNVYDSQRINQIKPNSSNRGISVNDKLSNIKNNKNKNLIILKNNKNNNINNGEENNNISDNSLFNINDVDLQSLDDISIKNMSINTTINRKIQNNKNINNKKYNEKETNNNNKKNNKKNDYKNNENINKKVIIDDYSEFDNIKSLNSMDNTLNDLISIIENDK